MPLKVSDLKDVYQAYEGDYSWSTVGIFLNERSQWLIGHDAGCSCNGPWDEHDSESDFEIFNPYDYMGVIKRAGELLRDMHEYDRSKQDLLKDIERMRKAVYQEMFGPIG